MSFLNWAYSAQQHKTRNGYYINHDNLIVATPEDRKKLIFYFIASQVPEKIEPHDRALFKERFDEKVTLWERRLSISTTAACLLFTPLFASRLGVRFLPSLAYSFVVGSLAWSWSEMFAHNLLEPRFVGTDNIVKELAKKYDFSVFDFAQAKKDAHLKALRFQLVSEGQSHLLNL